MGVWCRRGIIASVAVAALFACSRSSRPKASPAPAPSTPPADTRIDLLPLLAKAERPVGGAPAVRGFAVLRDDIREAFVAGPPAVLRLREVPVHPGATLRFACGAARDAAGVASQVTFVVRGEGAGGARELFRRALTVGADGTTGWVDADVALEEAAAGASRMTLDFETSGGDPSVHAAWAWPEVVSEGRTAGEDRTRLVADEVRRDLLATEEHVLLEAGAEGLPRRLPAAESGGLETPAAALVPPGSAIRWRLLLAREHRFRLRCHVARSEGDQAVAGITGFEVRLRAAPDDRERGPWRTVTEWSVDLGSLAAGAEGMRTYAETVDPQVTEASEFELELRGTGVALPPSVRAAVGAFFLVHHVDVPRAQRSGPGRNLVVLLVDTLGAAHLGTYGYERDTSPVLDALAAKGVVFEDVRAPVPSTVPSTAALLASRRPTAEGPFGHGDLLPFTRVTMAEAAQRAGWTTAAIVANAVLSRQKGFGQGFAEFHDAAFRPAGAVSELAASWIRSHRDERFLLYVHYLDPHAPYSAPDPWYGAFAEGYSGRVVRNTWNPGGEPWAELLKAVLLWGAPVDLHPELGEDIRREGIRAVFGEAMLQRLLDLYDAEVRYWDDRLGPVLQAIREAGLLDDTVVTVLSDHGEEFAEDGHLGHGSSLDDAAVRVPMVLAGAVPGEPRRIATPVSLVDVAPMMLELAGIPVPPEMEGRTLPEIESGRPDAVFSVTLDYVRTEQDAPPAYQTAVRARTASHDVLHLVRDDDWFVLDAPSGSTRRSLAAAEIPAELREAIAAFELRLRAREGRATATVWGPEGEGGEGPGGAPGGRVLEALRALGYVR